MVNYLCLGLLFDAPEVPYPSGSDAVGVLLSCVVAVGVS